MKIFTSAQIKELDRYTIEHEPIPSIDLMERAAKALTDGITPYLLSSSQDPAITVETHLLWRACWANLIIR